MGRHIIFESGRYRPSTPEGFRTLSHELVHTVQQNFADPPAGDIPVGRNDDSYEEEARGIASKKLSTVPGRISSLDTESRIQRMPPPDFSETEAMRGPAPPNATICGKNPECPPGFCDPFLTEASAKLHMAKNWWWIRLGISKAVDSKVLPLWDTYVDGGSGQKDLSATFASDFTASRSTATAANFLRKSIENKLTASPPSLARPAKGAKSVSTKKLSDIIPSEMAELNDPLGLNQLNFNIPGEIPGNIAGGIGTDQTACPAGAKPSPINDERLASGTVDITMDDKGTMTAEMNATFSIKDTLDLCPGNCGTSLEQIATVPLSQYEATGIAGDVPFTVDFPAPKYAQNNKLPD